MASPESEIISAIKSAIQRITAITLKRVMDGYASPEAGEPVPYACVYLGKEGNAPRSISDDQEWNEFTVNVLLVSTVGSYGSVSATQGQLRKAIRDKWKASKSWGGACDDSHIVSWSYGHGPGVNNAQLCWVEAYVRCVIHETT